MEVYRSWMGPWIAWASIRCEIGPVCGGGVLKLVEIPWNPSHSTIIWFICGRWSGELPIANEGFMIHMLPSCPWQLCPHGCFFSQASDPQRYSWHELPGSQVTYLEPCQYLLVWGQLDAWLSAGVVSAFWITLGGSSHRQVLRHL